MKIAQDIVELQIGRELEVRGTQLVHLITTTVIIGPVLLLAAAPAMRGMSVATVSSSTAATSTTRTAVCVPALQSTLRRLRSNNQESIPPLIKNKRGGTFVLNVKSTK